MDVTVRAFDQLVERFVPELLAEIQSSRDDDLSGEDVTSLEDATSNYTVYGEAVIHVFPRYLRQISNPEDEEALLRFMAFLVAWDDLSGGEVRSSVIPLWLVDNFDENPVALRYLPSRFAENSP